VDFTVVRSAHHVTVNPSAAKQHDAWVLRSVFAELASNYAVTAALRASDFVDSGEVGTDAGTSPSAMPAPVHRCLVIEHADRLSREAQHTLRRSMEQHSGACRVVLVCEGASPVIEPLRSRCLNVRVPTASAETVDAVLRRVAERERVAWSPSEAVGSQLLRYAGGDLRKAIHGLQAVATDLGTPGHGVSFVPDWEVCVADIARDIWASPTPRTFLRIRDDLYTVLINCVPPRDVLRLLLSRSLDMVPDDDTKLRVHAAATRYDHRMCRGSKPVLHLQGLVGELLEIASDPTRQIS
jgi:replication factor C subunit 3/5